MSHSRPNTVRSRPHVRYLTVAGLATGLLFAGTGAAWAAEEMTLDFVRHGQSLDNVAKIIGTEPFGPHLSATGEQQAQDVGDALFAEHGSDYYDGIWASLLIRTQETAAPLAALLGMDVTDLPGLNEIRAGLSEGLPEISPAGLLYVAPMISWALGLPLVPMLGSYNGVVFNESVNDAIQSMYDAGDVNGDGNLADVAFSSQGTILLWTLMNVKNPDLGAIFSSGLLPNTGVVEVVGSPEDGWTLLSWNGIPVAEDPGLPMELFLETRDLITAPQIAADHIFRALLAADPTMIIHALQEGVSNVVATTLNYPIAVIGDIVGALTGGANFADLTGDLAGLAATDAAGLLPVELGALAGEALTAI